MNMLNIKYSVNRDLVFSLLFMLAITSVTKIGSPKLYTLFPLSICVVTKKG